MFAFNDLALTSRMFHSADISELMDDDGKDRAAGSRPRAGRTDGEPRAKAPASPEGPDQKGRQHEPVAA